MHSIDETIGQSREAEVTAGSGAHDRLAPAMRMVPRAEDAPPRISASAKYTSASTPEWNRDAAPAIALAGKCWISPCGVGTRPESFVRAAEVRVNRDLAIATVRSDARRARASSGRRLGSPTTHGIGSPRHRTAPVFLEGGVPTFDLRPPFATESRQSDRDGPRARSRRAVWLQKNGCAATMSALGVELHIVRGIHALRDVRAHDRQKSLVSSTSRDSSRMFFENRIPSIAPARSR